MRQHHTHHHFGRRHHHEGHFPTHGHDRHSHRRGGGGGGRGHGERARRGESRYIFLDALRDGPRHGYEIIKALEERSSGRYAPSPGTVYPTLQYLAELELVRAEPQGERRVYHLTDAGRAELETHAAEVAAFWARWTTPATHHADIAFLQQELGDLAHTIAAGLRSVREQNSLDTIRRFRQTVERCKNDIRQIIAEHGSANNNESSQKDEANERANL